jgi:hypothetical protein
VYAAGTVDQMMCGKQFNRAVRAFILVYEALRSLWLSAFFQWCEDNDIVNPLPDPVRRDLYCSDSKADFTSWCKSSISNIQTGKYRE